MYSVEFGSLTHFIAYCCFGRTKDYPVSLQYVMAASFIASHFIEMILCKLGDSAFFAYQWPQKHQEYGFSGYQPIVE